MSSWDIKKLGNVCDFFNGQAHEKCIDENGKFKVINSKFIASEGETFKRTDEALSPLFRNDIVMVMSDVPNGKALAKCFLIDDDNTYTLNQRICVIRSNSFYPKFLYYQLNRNKYFLSFDNGENQTNLRKNDILNCDLFVPPLPEQQRIVSILDKAFAAIDKAKANAQQNLKNAKELFESYLESVFENKGADWEEKTLGEIGKPSMCKRILKHQTSSTGEIPFYKIGTFGKTPDAFISKEIYDEFRTKYSFPKKGDILISASGTIGRRVRYDGEPAFFQDSNIVWIDNDENQVLNDYLYVFYEFCDWQPSKGATISRLYNSNLTSIKIVFPKSLEEQKNILKKIDAVSIETKKLETIYQKKIEDLEELKKSILQKAFSGELNTTKDIAV